MIITESERDSFGESYPDIRETQGKTETKRQTALRAVNQS